MLGRSRFWLYRNIVALFTLLGFRSQKVVPLEAPLDGTVQFRPYADAYPAMPVKGLYLATTFPSGDHAGKRLKRITMQNKLLALVKRIAPERTPPVPADEAGFVAAVYPRAFRRAWPAAPTVPGPLVDTVDLVAELAVRGPFASFLRRTDDDRYEFGADWLHSYDVASGLARPGGTATLVVRDGCLVTERVESAGTASGQVRAALLAGLNEQLTTFRHNVDVHLTMLTSFGIASTNQLDARHPVRRLLHHCFNTVLIGNVELSSAQLSGPRSFLPTIFSHEADVLLRMVEDHLSHFDFWDYEPPTQFERRGTTQTPFEYSYRDNVMAFWSEIRDYVERYLDIYYDSDEAVARDPQLANWAADLDRLVPNGVDADGGITLNWLVRVCATLVHVSTVEHDILNNVVWDYTTLGWLTPTVVPLSGKPMDQRRSFDLIATLIGTWKPYNMLLTADVPKLALDERAAAVMRAWIDRLDRLQDTMTAQHPGDRSLSYPAGLNVSISN
ncbi:MAG: lipoxygenase family protein [Pseudonocardiales bacterium]